MNSTNSKSRYSETNNLSDKICSKRIDLIRFKDITKSYVALSNLLYMEKHKKSHTKTINLKCQLERMNYMPNHILCLIFKITLNV